MREEPRDFRYSFLPGVLFVSLMWHVFLLSAYSEAELGFLGIFPRRLTGLVGIVVTPFLHKDLPHLLSNSFPLLLLPAIMLISYPRVALRAFVGIYLVTGFWIWVLARPAYHIGASGVVYGLASFVFFSGVFRRERGAAALSFIIIFLYGGMIYGVFPTEERISWESHLIGGIVGMGYAFAYRKVDPAVEEEEPEEDDERYAWIPYQAIIGPAQNPDEILHEGDPRDEAPTAGPEPTPPEAPPRHDPFGFPPPLPPAPPEAEGAERAPAAPGAGDAHGKQEPKNQS